MSVEEESKITKSSLDIAQQNSELCCKGLSLQAKEADIKSLFDVYGTLLALKLERNKLGISQGEAFVKFSKPEEADAALEVNGYEHMGRKLTVEYKRSYPPSHGSISKRS